MEIYQYGSDTIKFRRKLRGNTMKAVLEPSKMESEYLYRRLFWLGIK